MKKNCGAVLALVVASSCGNSDDRMRDVEFLKRKLDYTREDVKFLKRKNEELTEKNENSNRKLEMCIYKFFEFCEDFYANKVLSNFGLSIDNLSYRLYTFSLKKKSQLWRLYCNDKSVYFVLYNDEFKFFLLWWLQCEGQIQGFEDFLKDEEYSYLFLGFLNFLNKEGLVGKKSCFGDNEYPVVNVGTYANFRYCKRVDVLMELFRICPNVKVRSKTGDLKDFSCNTVTYSPLGVFFEVVFKNESGESFYLQVKNDDELEKFKNFCSKKGWPPLTLKS